MAGSVNASGVISLDRASHNYKDSGGRVKTQSWHQEELRTSGVGGHGDFFGPSENDLRRDNNLPERGAY